MCLRNPFLWIILATFWQISNSCKKYVPDVEFPEETYPHWSAEIRFPNIPLPPADRPVVNNYGQLHQKNVDEGCTCGLRNAKAGVSGRVYGGTSTSPLEFPFQVALVAKNSRVSICGGSLINNYVVLTAAHCVLETSSPADYALKHFRKLQILLHAHLLNDPADGTSAEGKVKSPEEIEKLDAADGTIRRNIKETVVHHSYLRSIQMTNGAIVDGDIALIKLDEPIDLTESEGPWPSCLVDSDKFEKYPNEMGTIIGWGLTGTGKAATSLQKLELPIRDMENCRRLFKITNHFICIGENRAKDAGQGDSGGPLLLKNTKSSQDQFIQIGLASYQVQDTGHGPTASAYTRIGEYLPWIYNELEKWEKDLTWCKT